MAERRRQYDREFKEGVVAIVRETGKSIAVVARDMDLNPGTLAPHMRLVRFPTTPTDNALQLLTFMRGQPTDPNWFRHPPIKTDHTHQQQ